MGLYQRQRRLKRNAELIFLSSATNRDQDDLSAKRFRDHSLESLRVANCQICQHFPVQADLSHFHAMHQATVGCTV